jgi:DNA-binding NarL/FixJ family response regulator
MASFETQTEIPETRQQTLLVASNSVALRDRVAAASQFGGFDVVGRCDSLAVRETAHRLRPDVIVYDLGDVADQPLEVRGLHAAAPDSRLVTVSDDRRRSHALLILDAGASAYLWRGDLARCLFPALEASPASPYISHSTDDESPAPSPAAPVETAPLREPAETNPPIHMQEAKTLSIILADDHAIVREGLAALCSSNPRFRVIAQCADGEAALEAILAEKPDFAILDLHMPKLTGLEVIRRLRSQGCASKLIVLSIGRDDATVMEALRAGADAYLLKDGPSNHLLDAINFVGEGGVYVSPLLGGARLFTRGDLPRAEDPLASLSPREMEVFSYLVNGLRAKDIADLLDISPKTVDTYRASLMRKLGVHDLVGLVKFAIERNLTSTSPDAGAAGAAKRN